MPIDPQKILVHKNKLNTIYRELVILENSMEKKNYNDMDPLKKIIERMQVLIMLSQEYDN